MSVTEIIELIKKLPRDEQEQVFALLKGLVKSAAPREESPAPYAGTAPVQRPGPAVTEDFKRKADEMFKTNAELFRKLAR
jgi:hypothetical protein